MLKSIKVNGVGPVPNLETTFGSHVNFITGDNGLGKTFLLDLVFWMLADKWPQNRIALPETETEAAKSPTLDWHLSGKNDFARKEISAYFDFNSQTWQKSGGRHAPKSLVIYAAANNTFAVWDPARNWHADPTAAASGPQQPAAYQFDANTLANGLKEDGRSFCNGLIHDWSNWYYQGAKAGGGTHFKHLEELIGILSPPRMPLKCGVPRNVFAGDTREFPTLQMPNGEVAYPHWPGGVLRIVGLAYLLVWAWHEHLRAAKQRKEHPVSHLIVLVDDIESNLSPDWQRSILMALTRVPKSLDAEATAQFFIATHSPLVLASLEPHYDERVDMLFWLNQDGHKIQFQELFWVRHGDVNTWLMSIVFGLKQPRSVEAERAILAALKFMDGDTGDLKDGLSTRQEIGLALEKCLPAGENFLEYWTEQTKEDVDDLLLKI